MPNEITPQPPTEDLYVKLAREAQEQLKAAVRAKLNQKGQANAATNQVLLEAIRLKQQMHQGLTPEEAAFIALWTTVDRS